MHAVPTKRLLVYITTGVVVLVVGTFGLLSTRGGPAASGDGLVIDTGDAIHGFVVPSGSPAGEGVSGAEGGTGAPAGGGAAQAITTTTQAPRIWVQVSGAVRRPGVYQIDPDSRVFEAVLEAGGFTDDADQEAVALAALLSDGCRVYVPTIGELPDGAAQSPTASSAGITGGASGVGASGSGSSMGPISLNSATLEQLDTLPGIGPALAQQILTYRETLGPFTSVDQLTEVPGIGPSKLEQLRPLVGL